MTPNVIDISHHNTVKDFAALKASGIDGVIHKCTQGSGYVDPTYAVRRQAATDAGLLWGAYTFNTGDNIDRQVANFLSHAEPDAMTLMALDFEDNPGTNMSVAQAKLFLQSADAKLGRKLVLYSGNRVKDLLGDSVIDITLNAASAPAGAHIALIVVTSGTSSHNVTPSTNFKSTGALATGAVSGKYFTISFVGDGGNLIEISRTAAM